MNFIWPVALWLLAALPLLVVIYAWLLRRRKKSALRYASLALVREAMGARQSIRRHIPPLLFLLAIGTMIVASARPVAVVTLPSQEMTIILAIDVSGSMRATDVEPTRLAAAQAAAKAFVAEQSREVRIGIVSFAATASLVQRPTTNREDAIIAIERLQLQPGTAIGSSIIVSLAALFPDGSIDVGALLGGSERRGRGWPPDRPPQFVEPPPPVPAGSYSSGAIIVLTDGQRTTGPDSVEAARIAADRGVRVYTVGVGTSAGEIISFEGWSMRVGLDEDTLKEVADLTGGEYYYAGTATDLRKVYEALSSRVVLKKQETEVTALFSAAGAALALLSALLSLLWFNRML